MALLLGVVADDFTGATDIASMLVQEGMRTVQLIGVPASGTDTGDADAVVVALKSRTTAAADAVRRSLDALAWLQGRGATRFVQKYCSTFDSTADGNIGPVADAMLDRLASDVTLFCPAWPSNARSIFKGHLFVGDRLLHETEMRDHPLTPMTDSDLVRVLAAQTERKVGLLPYETVEEGGAAVGAAIARARADGITHLIADRTADRHLLALAEGAADLPLITGGSGIAKGLPGLFRAEGRLAARADADALPGIEGLSAVISGSCSETTQDQVRRAAEHMPSLAIDPMALANGRDEAAHALAFARERLGDGPVLIYSSAPAERVAAIQRELGRAEAGALVEDAMARIARDLVAVGVRRLVVAGGETSGAVVEALGIEGLRIGAPIDPGVPWTVTLSEPPLALALKSGKFGAPDFFTKAFASLS